MFIKLNSDYYLDRFTIIHKTLFDRLNLFLLLVACGKVGTKVRDFQNFLQYRYFKITPYPMDIGSGYAV